MGLIAYLRSLNRAINPKELAALMDCSVRSIYDAVAAGELPYFHLRSSIKFDPDHIADWLEAQMPKGVHVLAAAKLNQQTYDAAA
jgi:excisionase family DNA binding protein